MVIVSDTTAITTLLKAGRESILRETFGTVLVPQAVWNELRAFHSSLPDFISQRLVDAPDQRLAGTETLGRGEAEAIQLAKGIYADLFLTDDRKARLAALRVGVRCVGLLAVLVRAKSRGHLHSVKAAIDEIEARGGLYLTAAVKRETLKLAGEL